MGEIIECGGDSGGCRVILFAQSPALVVVPAILSYGLLSLVIDT